MSVLGPNLVTNGTFTGNADGWTLGGGAGYSSNAVAAPVEAGTVTQSISITAGKTYQVQIQISGTCSIVLGGTTSDNSPITYDGPITDTVVAGSSDSLLALSLSATCSLDNVTVKEVSAADNIEKAIYDTLRWDSTTSGIVSSRIYPQVIPQNTSLPAIVYSQISGIRNHTLGTTDNMVQSRWQFTLVAETYSSLRALSDAVRGALDNQDTTVGTVNIQCAHFIDESDGIDRLPGVDLLRRYTKIIECYIWYNE